MIPLLITIPGPPIGKGRPRARRVGAFVRIHSDPKSASWEGTAAIIIGAAWGAPALSEPVEVRIRAVASRPQRLLRRKDPEGRMWRGAKPDADNVAKAVGDALVRAGVLADDVWACRVVAESLYAAKGEGPCVEIEVLALAAQP